MPAAAERLVASLSHRFVQQSLHRLAHRSSMAASSAPNPKDVKLAAMRRGRLDDPEDEVDPKDVAKFGTVLGLAAGGTVLVPCYSSDYDSADRRVDYDSQSAEGVFYGYKWQCVEFARRWLVLNKKVTFQSIPMAYHIFQLPNVIRLSDGQRLPMIGHLNGSTTHPMAGDVLIWSAGGNKIGRTGHVAIITAASSEWVRVAEQNWDDVVWPAGQVGYGRQIRASVSEEGVYTIHANYILGWLRVPDG